MFLENKSKLKHSKSQEEAAIVIQKREYKKVSTMYIRKEMYS